MRRHLIYFILLLACVGAAKAEDWNKPTTTSNYADVISELKARDVSAAKLDYSSATNLPAGVIRWNDTSSRFEKWSGSAWSDLQPSLTSHLANTSNPHSTTAAQVGSPTVAQLSAHTSNTSNPHSVTAAQAGALSTANNLSDVASSTTARSNIGAASSSSLDSHTSNTSNPHSVTAAQINALNRYNNLSEVTSASTARGNIGAAQSGSNSDITALSLIGSIAGTYGITLNSGLGAFTFGASTAANRWKVETSGKITPPASLQQDYTVWPSAFTRRRSLDPSVATASQCAEAWNTLVEDLIAQGELK